MSTVKIYKTSEATRRAKKKYREKTREAAREKAKVYYEHSKEFIREKQRLYYMDKKAQSTQAKLVLDNMMDINYTHKSTCDDEN